AREWESAIDLYFYRARWYDPADGRFISEDPLYANHGSFDAQTGVWQPREPLLLDGGINLFKYTENAPTLHTDPSGMVTCTGPKVLVYRKTSSVSAAGGGFEKGLSPNPS